MKELFPPDPMPQNVKTCRTCQHRQRWQCGGSVFQYCGVRHSKRTDNGLMKIKVTMTACNLYKKEII